MGLFQHFGVLVSPAPLVYAFGREPKPHNIILEEEDFAQMDRSESLNEGYSLHDQFSQPGLNSVKPAYHPSSQPTACDVNRLGHYRCSHGNKALTITQNSPLSSPLMVKRQTPKLICVYSRMGGQDEFTWIDNYTGINL